MAPNGYEIVSNYAAGDAEISLTYLSAVTHTVYNLHSETPLVGKNSSSGSSSNTSYAVNYSTGSGYSPTDIFSMDPGHTFTYTGQPETYTVPAGSTSSAWMRSAAVGGSGVGDSTEPSGAQVTGTLNVTPGEVLTVGVGGMGGSNYIQKAGDNDWTHTYSGVPSAGWGLQNGTTSYAGGDGIQLSNGSAAGGFGGGGASVILDSNGDPLIVAGGGGGMSTDSPLTYGFGGQRRATPPSIEVGRPAEVHSLDDPAVPDNTPRPCRAVDHGPRLGRRTCRGIRTALFLADVPAIRIIGVRRAEPSGRSS